MIARLNGDVVETTLDSVVLDVNGVGYRVRVPSRLSLPREEPAIVHTHQVVREDALDLYGFATTGDRDLFATMLGVSGIGPKTALAAIDTLGADGLRRAVIGDDIAALTSIPGIGKKGAQRIALELKSKVGTLPGGERDTPLSTVSGDHRSETRAALSSLGYAAAEVEAALAAIPADAPVEEQLRRALRGLGG